jgi:hypothetical protein
MKYWLKDFEHNISPPTWETAEQLAASGNVRNLREIETHFWVARVDTEEASYETEVIITPQKIKAYACECFSPGRRLMCAHIAATLLKIRQFLEQKAEARRLRAEAAQSNALSRMTVQTVLENATPEEIEAFVRDYCRRDRDFALALKTWFAGTVTINENPYALLLDSVFPKSASLKEYRDPEFRRIRKALDGLQVQLNMSAESGNFRIVFQIATAILSRTLPVVEKLEGNRRDTMLHFCRLGMEKIAEMLGQDLSAELRINSWQMIFDLGMSGLFPLELQRNALQFLTEMGKSKELEEKIRVAYDNTPQPVPSFVLELYLCSLATRKMPEAISRVLEDFSEQPEKVHQALLQLYYLKHWDAAKLAGFHFLEKQIFQPKQQRELEDVLLYVVEKTGDKKRHLELLKQRFVKNGNLEVFGTLKKVAADKWPKVREQLIKELTKKGDINLLAAALAAEKNLEDLALLIAKEGTIPILQRYDTLLLPEQATFVKATYVHLLSRYLETHFGTPAAVYVRHRLSEFSQKGQLGMVAEIVRELIKLFPDRPSLPEELMELFPKAKKRAAYFK